MSSPTPRAKIPSPCLGVLAAFLAGSIASSALAGGGGGSDLPAAKPSPPTRELPVPVGRPVQLDGRVNPAEWEDAVQRPLGRDGTVLRLMQHRGTLLLSLASPVAWPEGAHLWLGFAPDGEDRGLYRPGAVRLDFEPREHNRPHLLVTRMTDAGEVLLGEKVVARAQVHGLGAHFEAAIPFEVIGVGRDATDPVAFVALWMRGRRGGTATWPPGLSTDGPPGRPPPDLETTGRWSRLTGWRDADGPGAFPASEWKAWVEADREMARRGGEAHGFVLGLGEMPPPHKEDAVLNERVVDNLRWIAKREPLTPYDLMALARTYRFLNRNDEALALLDALDMAPSWRGSQRVLYDRAVTLESAARYPEAAEAWTEAAERGPEASRARYRAMAARARERATAWQRELAARRADRARADLPLVLLRTSRGDVVVQVFAEDVPENAKHFLGLVRRREGDSGFYDGTLFHRAEGDFLVQGGDPGTRGGDCEAGGPGQGPRTLNAEKNARHGFWRGAVGLARGMAHVNGSQFFILVTSRPELSERGFTCLGQVISGMDVVDRLERCDELIEARVLEEE